MSKTKIEWTEHNFNPFLGCRHKSPGCKNCYAELIAARFSGTDKNGKTLPFAGIATRHGKEPRWTGEVGLNEEILREPLGRKKPTVYFVNSMSDTFYSKFPDEWIDKLFGVMGRCPQHIFQVLTKRVERMRDYMKTRAYKAYNDVRLESEVFPPPNIWCGTSVEDKKHKFRIDVLRATSAAVRWLSLEPLLEDLGELDLTGIDWVVLGFESGTKARPGHPDWARNVRDQCIAQNVPFFFKQWGEYQPLGAVFDDSDGDSDLIRHADDRKSFAVSIDGERARETDDCDKIHDVSDGKKWYVMHLVGKKKAGRILDGRTWDEFPG